MSPSLKLRHAYKTIAELEKQIEQCKQEQANMREHLQKWQKIYFDMDNEEISIVEAVEAMDDLYFLNPYEEKSNG